MPKNLLSLSGIAFGDDEIQVLKNIQFSQQPFQKIVIAGETGSGKSTLLKIIAGLEQPATGEVLFEDQMVKGPAEQLVPGHPEIAYLSQQFELPKFLRVEQVLEYSNKLTATREAKIFSVCRINHLLKRKTNELSGGEKQRIAIARLLIQQPKLLLLDEPFSNLDTVLKGVLKSVLDDIGRKLKITCILVSHDPDDTLPWADEILVLKAGRIVQRGMPKEIYRNPINTYVAGLFGNYTVLDGVWLKKLGIKTTTKKLIFRPEDFKLVGNGAKTLSGIIDKIHFLGDHVIIEVLVGEQRFAVSAIETRLTVGDSVWLKLNRKIISV